MHNDPNSFKVQRAVPPTADGTSAVNGEIIDTAGYEAVEFAIDFSTGAAGNTCKIQQGAAANMSDAADLADSELASAVSTPTTRNIVIQPRERYVRCVLARGTTCLVAGVAILTSPRTVPAVDDSGVVKQTLIAPEEGTA